MNTPHVAGDCQACEVPLIERLRSVEYIYRTVQETQWAQDGTPTGHRFIPVGVMMHAAAADEIERLTKAISDVTFSRDGLAESLLQLGRESAVAITGDVEDSADVDSAEAAVAAIREEINLGRDAAKQLNETDAYAVKVSELAASLCDLIEDGKQGRLKRAFARVALPNLAKRMRAALAKNPNPSGQNITEASARAQASGPVGLGSTNDERLRAAATALYEAGHWTCDHCVNADALWAELRDALGRAPGGAPKPADDRVIPGLADALNRHAEAAKRDAFLEVTRARTDIINIVRGAPRVVAIPGVASAPLKPTPEMIEAGERCSGSNWIAENVYNAMLHARPADALHGDARVVEMQAKDSVGENDVNAGSSTARPEAGRSTQSSGDPPTVVTGRRDGLPLEPTDAMWRAGAEEYGRSLYAPFGEDGYGKCAIRIWKAMHEAAMPLPPDVPSQVELHRAQDSAWGDFHRDELPKRQTVQMPFPCGVVEERVLGEAKMWRFALEHGLIGQDQVQKINFAMGNRPDDYVEPENGPSGEGLK